MMRRYSWMMVLVALGLFGCGDDASGSDASTDSGRVDSGMASDGSVDSGMLDGGPSGPSIVAEFDGASFELPESVAYHGGMAYLSFLNGSVVTVDASGTVSELGRVAIDPAGSAYALGITVADDGTVYVAMALASSSSTFAAGVYRIAAGGGDGELFASHPELFIPNDVAVDEAGNLFITADGRIYAMTGSTPGTATLWKEDASLASSDGTASAPCGVRTSPFPIGANGIVAEADRIVIGNTESGSLVAIAIDSTGAAGAATTIVTDTTELCGIDGLARDEDGSYLATVLGSSLVRVSADGAMITEIHTGLPFRSPAGVDVGMFGTTRHAIVANPDFEAAFGAGGPASAMPNLTAVPL